MNPRSSPIAAALIASATIAARVQAGSVSVPMHVSVRVIARAIVTVDAQPTIEVTAGDVARGYVEVRTVLHGRTNSRSGYLLRMLKTTGDFSSIDLDLPDATMRVTAGESWIARPYVPGGEVVPATARMFLAPATMPGPHALPVSFSASPL